MPANPISPKRSQRIAIVGGGVVGLACALALKARGADVSVYERGLELGSGATTRSAGMLGAAFEWGLEEDQLQLAALARHAGQIWPDFAAKVERLGDGGIEHSIEGALVAARSEADVDWIERLAAACQARDQPVQRLTETELKRREPCITAKLRGGLLLPEDRQVDPSLLLQRLGAALRRAGVGLKFGRSVERVVVGRDIAMPDGERFDSLVLASGAGQQPKFHGLRGELLETGLGQIVPVKGQMLALAPISGGPRHVVQAKDVYIAPKARWILIGATLERGKDDVTVDRGSIEALKAKAAALAGGLGKAPEVTAWAGVRPGTPDDQPMIGETALPGVFAALGCYRNGVLLAPAVAELAASAILDGRRPPEAFSPLRFHTPA